MKQNSKIEESTGLLKSQLIALFVLRLLIGWHFLYEGVVKIINPQWSSASFLKSSQGPLSGLFNWLAEMPAMLAVIDFLNMWGLTLIGLALILGIFTRYAYWGGMALLALYYLATPPFIGYNYAIPMEGNYLLVNKNLIEIAALFVLSLFQTSHILGLDRLLPYKNSKR